MGSIASNIKIYALCIGGIAFGAMMSDVLDSLMHNRFRSFYADHAVLFWLTIPINAAVIYLLVGRARQVVRERRDPAIPQEKAGVGPSLVGVKFHTTPFIRI